MTIFYLTRHGEKENTPGDPGLSEIGKKQTLKTAEYFSSLPIDQVYSSPLNRAKATAQIIAGKLGLEVVIDPALKERMNWERPGQSFEDFLIEWEHSTQNPNSKPSSGDSVHTTAKRLHEFMLEAALHYPDQNIVVITHGGTIRDFLSFLPGEHKKVLEGREQEGIHNCSITKMSVDNDMFKLLSFDDTNHLESS